VDVNSGVDLNRYALLDEWSLLKNKNVIVYTFDENTMNFKVEYPTMVSSTSVIEILKTSIDDIVISYHAITDKKALLKKLRALYNYKKEPIKVIEEEDRYPCITCTAKGLKTCTANVLKSAEERKREKFEAIEKEKSRHVNNSDMWCQLTSTMKKQILKCPECYPWFYMDECPDTGYFARSSYRTEVTPNNYTSTTVYGTPFHALMMSIKEYEKYPHLGYKKGYEENLKGI